MNAIQTLLHQSIDYAGLFPPAGLGMSAAVENYRRYKEGADAWALGRFIVPASRLAEFAAVAAARLPDQDGVQPWPLSVLVGPDFARDLEQIAAFERNEEATTGRLTVDAVEAKTDELSTIEEVARQLSGRLLAYFELPSERDPTDLLTAIARHGARAKVRTGGVTPQAFPSAVALARFILACTRTKVPFKATAGLHHALRAEYPLTYEEGSGKAVMFGFLNLFLATALVRQGITERETCAILEESSPNAFRVENGAISWRNHRLPQDVLQQARESLVSFGSCSFTEPIAELQSYHWLQPAVHRA
jgi:hypothetical protein